jgi:capsular polysaccharide transport system permease protein
LITWIKKITGFWLIVILPMLFVIIYYTFFAANRYVSETVVTVRQANNSAVSAVSGLAMLAGVSPSSREDVLFLREYIHSLDMLKILDKKLAVRSAYEAQKSDPFFRLYGWMSKEWFLWYYRNRVEVVYDDMTGLLRIRTEAFTAEQAQAINKAILSESERFVNELSHRMSRDQMAFAEDELKIAKERYMLDKSALVSFQNTHAVFDPVAQAQAKASLFEELDSTIAKKEAELGAMLSYLQESAPQVVALRSEITALKVQASKEKGKIASVSGGEKLNSLASNYQDLVLEAGFAEDAYKVALTSVEKTRIEASEKVKQLAVIQSPILPETAEYPKRLYNLITIFIFLLLLAGITRLIKATIEDHKY